MNCPVCKGSACMFQLRRLSYDIVFFELRDACSKYPPTADHVIALKLISEEREAAFHEFQDHVKTFKTPVIDLTDHPDIFVQSDDEETELATDSEPESDVDTPWIPRICAPTPASESESKSEPELEFGMWTPPVEELPTCPDAPTKRSRSHFMTPEDINHDWSRKSKRVCRRLTFESDRLRRASKPRDILDL